MSLLTGTSRCPDPCQLFGTHGTHAWLLKRFVPLTFRTWSAIWQRLNGRNCDNCLSLSLFVVCCSVLVVCCLFFALRLTLDGA